MEKMNLFETKEEPKRKMYSDDFKKEAVELANEIGNSNAAKELGVSTNSINNWRKTINSAPIQDPEGNLTFTLDGNTYTLNVNSKDERESILKQITLNSLLFYNWFKEDRGEEHWVLYNTEMYEVRMTFKDNYLHYKDSSNLTPIIPINATSCYSMFRDCNSLTTLEFNKFDTSNIVDASFMFYNCTKLTNLYGVTFDTSKVVYMSKMFSNCQSLVTVDMTRFDTGNVINMCNMFQNCLSLLFLDLSNFVISDETNLDAILDNCTSLKTVKATDPELFKHIRENYPQIQIA